MVFFTKKNKMTKTNNIIVNSPLDQFNIVNLLNIDVPLLFNIYISLTNIGLYMILGTILIITINLIATNNNRILYNDIMINI